MRPPDIRKEYRYGNYLLALALAVLAILPLAANLYASLRVGANSFPLPTCSVLQHTGKRCAGCGLTRSVLAFYNGDLELSHAWHPLGYVFVLWLLLELMLRPFCFAVDSVWLPWADIGQILVTGFLVKCVLLGSVSVSAADRPPLAFSSFIAQYIYCSRIVEFWTREPNWEVKT